MRHIDHIVVAVRNLDEAGDFYRKLGFQVGVRNRHPWGTENRLIQFRSSFIELITAGENATTIPRHEERSFSFGAFVRDYLRKHEGLAMLVLNSTDAKADASLFAKKGIGDFEPFTFERTGRRPDGSETCVAFTLAFALDAKIPDAAFFVCQQHFPENFWNTDFQRHTNGATNISAVTLAAPEPAAHAAFLSVFSGAESQQGLGGNRFFRLDGGRIDVFRNAGKEGSSVAAPLLTSFSVRGVDIARQASTLQSADIPFKAVEDMLTVPPRAAFGVEIRFEIEGSASPTPSK